MRGGVLLDVEHGFLPGKPGLDADEQLDRLIERRAEEQEEANRVEAAWAKSARRYDLRAKAENRRVWVQWHRDHARLHAQLSEEHRVKAMRLMDAGAAS